MIEYIPTNTEKNGYGVLPVDEPRILKFDEPIGVGCQVSKGKI